LLLCGEEGVVWWWGRVEGKERDVSERGGEADKESKRTPWKNKELMVMLVNG